MKFTFVAAAMHAALSTQPLQTDVGVYPADEVYSIAKIMKTYQNFILFLRVTNTMFFFFLH